MAKLKVLVINIYYLFINDAQIPDLPDGKGSLSITLY